MKEQDIKRLFKAAKQKREIHQSDLREVYQYVNPQRRFRFDLAESDNQLDRKFVYDSAATVAMRNLITWTMKLLIPQQASWAEIVIRDSAPNANQLKGRMGAALEEANQRLHKHFVDSNFYMATTEALTDAVCAGTYCVSIFDEPGKPLRYLPVPVDEIFFLENAQQQVDCTFRHHLLTGRQLLTKPWDIPREIRDKLMADPTKNQKITERVIPDGRKFAYVVWMDDCKILYKDEMELNSFIVSRWEKIISSAWGNSPCRSALPDIRTINRQVRDMLAHSGFVALGLWQADEEIFGNLDRIMKMIKPGQILPCPKDSEIKPVQFSGNFNLTFEIIDRTRKNILDHMLGTQQPDMSQMQYAKAAAVEYSRQQFEALIGEPALRIEREYLKPIAEQTTARLFRRGELRVMDGGQLKSLGVNSQLDSLNKLFRVDTHAALSKLLKMQEASDTLQSFGQCYQILGPQVVAAQVDVDKMAREILPALGVAERFMRSPDDAAKISQTAQTAMANNGVQSLVTAFQKSQATPPEPSIPRMTTGA